MAEDKEFADWKKAAETRGYTPAEIKESYDFVQQEAEDKAIKAWEEKAKKEPIPKAKDVDEEITLKEPLYHTGYDRTQLDSTEVSINVIESESGNIIKVTEKASTALIDIDDQMETYYALLDCVS